MTNIKIPLDEDLHLMDNIFKNLTIPEKMLFLSKHDLLNVDKLKNIENNFKTALDLGLIDNPYEEYTKKLLITSFVEGRKIGNIIAESVIEEFPNFPTNIENLENLESHINQEDLEDVFVEYCQVKFDAKIRSNFNENEDIKFFMSKTSYNHKDYLDKEGDLFVSKESWNELVKSAIRDKYNNGVIDSIGNVWYFSSQYSKYCDDTMGTDKTINQILSPGR